MVRIKSQWNRILNWYRAHAERADLTLFAGASNEELADVEARIGFELPNDLRDSYQLYNGSQSGILPRGQQFLPLCDSLSAWETMGELLTNGELPEEPDIPDEPIRTLWWNLKWFPFTHSGGGDYCCVDMDPLPEGRPGQVIYFGHEFGPVRVEASSFSEWLERFARDLENGRYEIDSISFELIDADT